MTGFIIQWWRNVSIGCSDVNQRKIEERGLFSNYTITGVEPGNRYAITVRLLNAAGIGQVSNTVAAMTEEDGEKELLFTLSLTLICAVCSSIWGSYLSKTWYHHSY